MRLLHNIGDIRHSNYHTRDQILKSNEPLGFDGIYLNVYENKDILKEKSKLYRENNSDKLKESDKKWRIIVDGIEHLVDEIEIKCKSFTSTDYITCNSKNVSFVTKKNQFKAIVL